MSLVSKNKNNSTETRFEWPENRKKESGMFLAETITRTIILHNLICSFTGKQISVLIKGLFGSNNRL